ncbi:DUF4241 domain-containing protein [Sphingobacterium sp. BIGb0165]|uniref:DUF4241 domain-containing protein n=1 Tax=Sphingobacterium sp. BIGb0165 TaxID=2940615 RepID=UPI00216AA2B7|nr:DUF4241 domain-containing protein [Sphingobacterium sp. BIGb0165]MCS4224645.1 hypothetical protein [Sphingobacterium sp. BIGb0165]
MCRSIITICMVAIALFSCSSKNKAPSNNNDILAPTTEFDLTDTIPKITIQDSTLAFPKIFEGSFAMDTKVAQFGTEITFDKVAAGNLKVSSGHIIATDPVTLSNAIAFNEKFPIGEFPVELAMANINANKDRRVAFARVKFSEKPIRKWEFALLPGQAPIPLNSKEIYGYGVDAGLGLFVDQVAKDSLNTLLDKNWDNMFSEKFEHYLNYSFQNQNAVFFSTGYGDGFYATYIGRDSEGKICQLLTDFDIVLWRNVAK